jgi:hypothetical protein
VVSGEPLPDEDLLERLAAADAGTLRFNLGWGTVQPRPGPYDWSRFDEVVGEAAERGIRVLPTIYGSPPWVEPEPERPPLDADAKRAFGDFVLAAAERSGQGGSLWQLRPEIEPAPIRDWQLWNEPNSVLFWKPRPSTDQYLELLRSFDSALERADPAARVVLAGLFPTPRGGIPSDRFLRELHDAGADGLYDAIAIHPYATTPARALDAIEGKRELLNSLGERSKPIWVTEIGWASGGTPSPLTVGPERQAEYLTETFRAAEAAREELQIEGVLWYSLTDLPGRAWPSHSGLLAREGDEKPAWDALAELASGD